MKMQQRLEKLRQQDRHVEERLSAGLEAWELLLGGGQLASMQVHGSELISERMHRLRTDDPVAWFDRVLAPPSGHAQYLTNMDDAGLYFPRSDHTEELAYMARLTGARMAGDTLVFERGKYAVNGSWVMPHGTTIILERGARFFMGPGASVLCQGPLLVRGTSLNPVFIRAAEDSVFGTFAVIGDGSFSCEIHGLRMSGGSEAVVNGTFHSAMLSVHRADVVMENCAVGGSHGEDAVNVRQGMIRFTGCVFENGQSDLVDLDLVSGSIEHCVFRTRSTDLNGDGLDLSGSRLTIQHCELRGFPDKGLSVGEGSEVFVRDCSFVGNVLAIAVKDRSVAHVAANTFTSNALVVQVNQKKAIHGGAELFLYANAYVGNTEERDVDQYSRIIEGDEPSEEVLARFGVTPDPSE